MILDCALFCLNEVKALVADDMQTVHANSVRFNALS
jgi:hypothetical protein